MQIVTYIVAVVLGFLGLVFVIGAQGQLARIVVGVILMAGAGVLVYLTRVQPEKKETTVVQKIDLSGDVKLEEMRCRNCGGSLDQDALSVRGGAIFVDCPYCGASYQIEEAPKW